MFARPSFFADIVQPSARPNISRAISRGCAIGVTVFALLDEPGVLGEPAGVEEETACRCRSQSARTPRRFAIETG